MKVKTQKEFQALDEELNLFEDSDWDFLSVLETHEENYELFEDVEDVSLSEVAKDRYYQLMHTALLGVIALILIVWFGGIVLSRRDAKYESFQVAVDSKGTINYINGTEVSGETLIDLNKVLSSYFNTMQSKSDYSNLSYMCLDKSAFEQSYRDALSKMSSNYDKYDCRARAMTEFGSYLKINKIKKAIEKDGKYYVYCDITIPSEDDVNEYIHLYSYNLTKNFMNNEVNSQNIARFLLETMDSSPVPCTTNVLCFEMVKADDNTMRLTSDAQINSIVNSAYETAVEQISLILGSTLTDSSF